MGVTTYFPAPINEENMIQQQLIALHEQLTELEEDHRMMMHETMQCLARNKQILTQCSEILNKIEQRENDIKDIVDFVLQTMIQNIESK